MMYSNKKSHIAAICVSRVALAYLVFGAGGAFSSVQEVEIVSPNILKVSLEGSDTDVFVNTRVQNDVYVRPANEGFPWLVEVDMGGYGDLGAVLADIHQETGYIFGIRERVQEVLTNLVAHGRYLSHIEQYTQVASENSTNLPAIKNALYYDGEESIAEIVADIRNRMTNQTDFALGSAYTNFVAAMSYYWPLASTNYVTFADILDNDSGQFARQYGLQPIWYQQIFHGLPVLKWGSNQQRLSMLSYYPDELLQNKNNYLNGQANFLRALDVGGSGRSNMLDQANARHYAAYNTFWTYHLLTNFFGSANFTTFTNVTENTPKFAIDYFDSYNTKFQNLLLEYGTLAAITNENKQQVAFARDWYDSYSPRVILEYLLNSDFLNGTNNLYDTLVSLDDKVDSYSVSKLPTFGLSTNSLSIDMGVIDQTPDSGYKSVGDDIKDQDYNQASYLNDGWRIFDAVQDKYENAIDIIIGQIFELDGRDSKAFRDGEDVGGGGLDSVGLSLRVNPVSFDNNVIIPEQYIDFTLPSKAKDKLEDYWSLIKAALEWGMWIWAFLYCWNLLAGSDTKQSSPTILD